MTMTLRRRKALAWLGFAVIAVVAIAAYLVPQDNIRPWPASQYGGERVHWNDSIRAEWDDVMACVGLDRTPDPSLVLWQIPMDAPRLPYAQGLPLPGPDDVELLGVYLPLQHHIVVRVSADPAVTRSTWRHEFLHGRFRSAHSGHEPAFYQYAAECELGDPSGFARAR